MPIHAARSVQSWSEEHEDALQHFPWPAQLPDLNIIEPLLPVLEQIPPPSTLKKPKDVQRRVVQYSSSDYSELPRMIQAELQANGGPTPYQSSSSSYPVIPLGT